MGGTKAAHRAAGSILAVSLCLGTSVWAEQVYDPSADLAGVNQLMEKLRALPPVSGDSDRLAVESPRVAVYGDSTASILTVGLASWLDRTGTARPRLGVAQLGCGLLEEGDYRFRGEALQRPDHCRDRASAWEANVAAQHPQVAVVSFGPWEVCDRRWTPGTSWQHIGMPEFDRRLRQEMNAATDSLAAGGARVIWVTQPGIQVRESNTGELPETPFPESAPERMRRYNELVRELAASRPETVQVLELAEYLRRQPGGEFSADLRSDGIHLEAEAALRISNDFVGPEILRLAAIPLAAPTPASKSR